ncbi:hypothetical protein FISHEDRAFT_77170 [Fistulina hepatica ATCC 64428]|uniref:Uncharacterized protein n=1 Tax=Fistulina hepatica ATCC 64428 TaxID=1128425 RepID=A0A0D7A1Y2_9AGAR|nr:hypothetical protein FISHEDRAFT_77170 [Fistulina hepatica ATCC 64428]
MSWKSLGRSKKSTSSLVAGDSSPLRSPHRRLEIQMACLTFVLVCWPSVFFGRRVSRYPLVPPFRLPCRPHSIPSSQGGCICLPSSVTQSRLAKLASRYWATTTVVNAYASDAVERNMWSYTISY